MSHKLYVGSLPLNTTEEHIRTLFSKAGEVTDIYLSVNRYTAKSSGFAFIEMTTEAAANKAVELFHGYSVADRILTVQTIDQAIPAERNGASKTIVIRKFLSPAKESKIDDGKSLTS